MKSSKIVLRIGLPLIGLLVLFGSFTVSNEAKPKTYTVEIVQMQFQPATLTVNKGDIIIFVNKDIVAHDVTEVNKAWKSPALPLGSSWKMVATKTADYFCSIHVVMKGKIIVK